MPVDTTTDATRVSMTPPNFNLQKKLGGAAGKILTPVAFQKAQQALNAALPPLTDEVERLMVELEQALQRRDTGARDLIWNNAHEIRGLAGTAGKKSLGAAANLICKYLDGSSSNFEADPTVLATIAIVARQATKEGADENPMINMLLTDSARAVAVQRNREGRGVSD